MKRKKCLINVIIVAMLCLFICGCEKNKESKAESSSLQTEESTLDKSNEITESTIESVSGDSSLDAYVYPGKKDYDEEVLSCGKYNLDIYEQYSTSRFIKLNIYSAKELSDKDIQINIDKIKTPYNFIISKIDVKKSEKYEMIKKMLAFCNDSITPESLSKMDISSILNINKYEVIINFDMESDNLDIKREDINVVNVIVDGKNYDVNVGNVSLVYGTVKEFEGLDVGDNIANLTAGALEYPVLLSNIKNSAFEYNGLQFATPKDIEIIDIGIINGDKLSMQSAVIKTTSDIFEDSTKEIDFKKGQIIKIKKNISVNVSMIISDQRLSESVVYNESITSALIYIKYKVSGKEYIYITAPVFKKDY